MVVAFFVVVAGILICIYIGVRRVTVGRDVLRHGVVVMFMRGAECLRQRRLHRTYRKDQREQPINQAMPIHGFKYRD
jgi:multisubunit Na+/H+ antiporter MnhC subunit